MAPDKIFVSIDPFGFMSGYYMENHPPHGEEYIRKDALLEWAKEKANDYKGTANIRRSFEMLIRKINSL
jgi:hypothetical protein